MNDRITSLEVRVVDADGEMRGVMPLAEGIKLAEEAGLDLVEVSPNAKPPVCKVLDHGKYKYYAQLPLLVKTWHRGLASETSQQYEY